MDASPRTGESSGKPADSGITLLELLMGMFVAVLLMSAVYYLYQVSTRSYRIEAQVIQAMEQARFGMEMLRRDISAAGFLATPDSTADPTVCLKPGTRITGIYFERLGDVHEAATNQNIQPNAVTLFGAYVNPSVFFTHSIVGNLVTLQPMTLSRAEFNALFNCAPLASCPNRRYLRIVTQEQDEIYVPIVSGDYDNRTVTLAAAVPPATPPGLCGYPGQYGYNAEVSVAGYIRYSLRRDTRLGAPAHKIDLVREELDVNRNPVLGTRLIVAEYVADLQFYDFVRDKDLTRNDPDLQIAPFIEDVVDSSGAGELGSTAGSRPQDLRFVTIKLTTRTSDEDPVFPFRARACPNPAPPGCKAVHAPLDSYDLDTTMEGSARTVTLASRVELKAFAVRNVK